MALDTRYTQDTLSLIKLTDVTERCDIEGIWIKLIFKNKINILLSCIYK